MNRKASWKSTFHALLYLLPMLVLVFIFTVRPIFKSFSMSFYDNYNMFTQEHAGYSLDNYRDLFADNNFWLALKNTALYVVTVVPISIILSLFISLMLFRIPKLRSFFRTVYFLPYVTSTVAISVVWAWLYHSRYGLINYLLGLFNIGPVDWLNNPDNSMLAVIIMAIWKGLGYNILMFLVGLGNIDEDLYKAARVDGASSGQMLREITLPLLRPTFFLLSTVGIINGFKVFDEVRALFSGRPGPAGSALTLVYYLFQKFYEHYEYGIAAASGVILFLIVLLITIIQFLGNRYYRKRGG